MVAVLEDADRQSVLRIQTLGFGTFMSVVEALQALGLEDRLEAAAGPERGVDAAFS